MRRYAEGTSVPVDRSRAEIERALTRYGATGFGYQWERRVIPVTPAARRFLRCGSWNTTQTPSSSRS